jgi:hypothetical protein
MGTSGFRNDLNDNRRTGREGVSKLRFRLFIEGLRKVVQVRDITGNNEKN